ncbi:hypothetical protein ZHAS_00011056 [Anopheles sinensis]|uniref:Uncharacterized protein n=1 Tax=Anopheles sinensis TaxID=74873 RepID=A0A084VZ80_ANOSI|nr:hypothetical protein ZHAS_00011056 [Anopheles sinensis]
MVCPPCSTTVRNFYSFTKLTEASQKKLQAKYMDNGASSSLDELLQYVKAEPDVDVNAKDVNDANILPLFMSDDVAMDSDNESTRLTRGMQYEDNESGKTCKPGFNKNGNASQQHRNYTQKVQLKPVSSSIV